MQASEYMSTIAGLQRSVNTISTISGLSTAQGVSTVSHAMLTGMYEIKNISTIIGNSILSTNP
jgi:hypothetical protein